MTHNVYLACQYVMRKPTQSCKSAFLKLPRSSHLLPLVDVMSGEIGQSHVTTYTSDKAHLQAGKGDGAAKRAGLKTRQMRLHGMSTCIQNGTGT
jgi:hypothetical protein